MGSIRRFNAFDDENSVFKFRIDTTKIVSGATNGSKNPLTFKIPMTWSGVTGNETQCIIRVSDGRPDVSVVNTASDVNSKSLITFSTSGIYDIEIIGKVGYFPGFANTTVGYDRLKMIGIYKWAYKINFQFGSFSGCSNLIIYAENTLKLPANSNIFFANIGGFTTNRLDNLIFTDVTTANSILIGVSTVFTSLFNPFMTSMTSLVNLYSGVNVSAVSRVEIISDPVTTVGSLFGTTLINFSGELILSTPNNTNIQALCYYFNVSPSLGKVDIRSVTNALNFIRNPMTKARTDDTLLGWVNNFDWSGIAPVTNKVTLDFKGSTHTNSTDVNNAKAFLIAKGYVFTNLTAV